MDLIDTHCHIESLDEKELEEQISGAHNNGVNRLICVGASRGYLSSVKALELATKKAEIWCTIGIHPHDAGEFLTLDLVEELINHDKVVAIGETGLDFFKDWSPRDAQETLFRNSISIARNAHKPLIIHCREAGPETLHILQQERAGEVGGVFHCYAQDAIFASKLLDLGFLVSFTGNITFRNADELRKTVKQIPLTQIMIETDSPYLAPEPYRGKPCRPEYVLEVAKKIAQIKELSISEVAKQTTKNAENLFKI